MSAHGGFGILAFFSALGAAIRAWLQRSWPPNVTSAIADDNDTTVEAHGDVIVTYGGSQMQPSINKFVAVFQTNIVQYGEARFRQTAADLAAQYPEDDDLGYHIYKHVKTHMPHLIPGEIIAVEDIAQIDVASPAEWWIDRKRRRERQS
ncbi:MAG TPA: hypothetical protein VGR57_07595 [Ktedonobacterales bacterium]|nr:hypothetical protein [Ktedonobacterales bacterium]